MSQDLSDLLRKEVQLAKVEIKQEATKAGKSAGLFGATGVAAVFSLLMLSFAGAWGLAVAIPTGFAFLVVGCLYAIGASSMLVVAKKKMHEIHPPEQTVETLKEDVEWAKHPTS
jgi:hypothetical protein